LACDHFVLLTIRVFKSSGFLLKNFLLAWFQKSFKRGRSWGYSYPDREI